MAFNLLICVIRVTLLQITSLLLVSIVPMYNILFTDDKEMIIPVILPFIDPNTTNGFYLNVANQLVISGFGAFIVPGSELVSCITSNNLTVTAHMINNSLIEFNELLNEQQKFTKKHMEQFEKIVKQISDFHGFASSIAFHWLEYRESFRFTICRLVREINCLLYWKFLIHPMIALYSISVAIFSYLIVNVSVLFFKSIFLCLIFIRWFRITVRFYCWNRSGNLPLHSTYDSMWCRKSCRWCGKKKSIIVFWSHAQTQCAMTFEFAMPSFSSFCVLNNFRIWWFWMH